MNLDFCFPIMMEEAGRVATTIWVFPWIADSLNDWILLIRIVRNF
jgi:hypothetical protein